MGHPVVRLDELYTIHTKFSATPEAFPSRVQYVPVDGEDELEVEIFPFGDVLEDFLHYNFPPNPCSAKCISPGKHTH